MNPEMPLSTSLLAYADCMDAYARAEASDLGIRVRQESYAKAAALRLRMNYARQLDRESNAKTYEIDHPLHGQSTYDEFSISIIEISDQWYMYIKRIRQIAEDQIEVLTEEMVEATKDIRPDIEIVVKDGVAIRPFFRR